MRKAALLSYLVLTASLAALFIAVVPLSSHAQSRVDARFEAGLLRSTAEPAEGSTGGTGGTNGGGSGESGGTEATSTDPNVNQDMAEDMFDDLITNGPDADELPPNTDIDADEVEDEVEDADTNSSPGSSFLSILNTIILRFRTR